MSAEEDSLGERKFYSRLHIFYLAASVITLAECFLTFLINTVNKALKEKETTAFANNLAGSTGILSSTSLVCNVYFMMESFPTESSWPCLLLSVFVRYLHIVSSFSLACLSLERYVAICWPLHYFQLTRGRCRLLCLACWLAPCVLLLLPCASQLSTLCSTTTGVSITFLSAYTVLYTLGSISNFVFYVLVALEFRRERDSHAHDKDQTERLLRTRTAESAIKVIAFYVLLSLPHVGTFVPAYKCLLLRMSCFLWIICPLIKTNYILKSICIFFL